MGMSEAEYKARMSKIRKKNTQKKYKRALRAERRKYSTKRIETSKLLAIYLFVLFNVVLVFAMTAMWTMHDLTYLGVLISDIAAQVLVYAIYCLKAYCAKKQAENVKLRREKMEQDQTDSGVSGTLDDVLSAGAESPAPVPLANGAVLDMSSCENNMCGIGD